jgi:NAD(P)-dependent dehydrogenase (short-subunit alcohol dehydrogenase family)
MSETVDDGARVALVTGANRGIGAATAAGLVRDGWMVAVGARDVDHGAEVAASLSGPGAAYAVRLDVTDPSSVTAAVDEVLARSARIDALINNAGGHYDSGVRASEVGDDDLLDAIEINVAGPWRLVRAVLPAMRRQGRGRIVNVSSRSGSFTHTWADAPGYGVSKAALNMFTVQLAKDLEGSGILVNACCPGWVRTRMGGDDAERSVDEGADTPIWLASLPDDGPTGGFFGDRLPLEW